MGGQDKGLVEWRGQPMVEWLHRLVRPLTDDLIISCNRNRERYQAYADHLVADHEQNFQGPLAGIRAGLQIARHEQLLILPCDAPRVDQALLDALLALAGDKPVMVNRGGHREPLFSVIPTALKQNLEQAWLAGERSPQHWMRALHAEELECSVDDSRLSNFNTFRDVQSRTS